MEWVDKYGPENEPSDEEIAAFIDSPLWEKINSFLQDSYDIKPAKAYSGCSGQPGWNIKYKKAGRSLCVLYPLSGSFIVLVVIGAKEYEEALEILPECTQYTQELFERTDAVMGGRWLMMHITSEEVLEDAKRFIQARRKIK